MNSIHNVERDRIAREWSTLVFTCDACLELRQMPEAARVATEVLYKGRLRADIAALDSDEKVLGVVEVIRTRPPSLEALAVQSQLGFAFYRELDFRRSEDNAAYWFCSYECREYYMSTLRTAGERESSWEPRKCDWCGLYFHRNPLSRLEFFDWREPGDYTSLCIHCAVASSPSGLAQWRAPGELAGGDPREWTPFDDDDDPAALYLAFCEAAFWNMVWTERVVSLAWNTCGRCQVRNENPLPSEYGQSWWCRSCDAENEWPPEPPYDGSNDPEAEDATARRLPLVNDAFNAGDWHQGTMLLLPVGAPGWASYEDEPERMLAFRPENCKGVAEAWGRLLEYRRDVLPEEVKSVMDSPESYCNSLHSDSMGRYVPSESDLQEYERQRSESTQLRRESALRREQDQERFIQDAVLMREAALRKHEEEQEMWAELNKVLGDAAGGYPG